MDQTFEKRKKVIYDFICDDFYIPMKVKEIATVLQVSKEQRRELQEVLDALVEEGKITLSKRGKYSKGQAKRITGTFQANIRGFGFVMVEGEDEDIFIPGENVNGAFQGDEVECIITGAPGGKRKEGKIVRIVSHQVKKIVGLYEKSKSFGFVRPDNQRYLKDIYIPAGKEMGAMDGHKVVVELTSYGQEHAKPEGKIVEIIGHVNDPGADILSIVKDYDLPTEFPEKVLNQAVRVGKDVSEADCAGRLDLRDWQMVTIDGEDAKDLDDAVSLTMKDENYQLGVHIADVTNYVQEKSALDREALKRGTSVYLADRVIPMLPHVLSNGICSLNAGEDRLALSCIMTVSPKGEVIDHQIAETVIRVDKRMSYTGVSKVLAEEPEALEEDEDFVPMIQNVFSNVICSLNAGEDRLALSCIMTVSPKGEVIDHQIAETVIQVDKRMSYTGVSKVLAEEPEALKEDEDFVPMIQKMQELSTILRERRGKRGSIDFDFPETKIELDEKGKPINIKPYERNSATKIIEDFMLLANETVAEEYFWREVPFLYRTHEVPDEEKIKKLSTFINNFGYHIHVHDEVKPKEIQKLLSQVEGTPEEALISRLTLRSMCQAKYTTENTGHFGLAAKYYTHFTSPIRRYPDLQIHRIIKENLRGRLNENRIEHYDKILPEVAKQCSDRERLAEETEREVVKMKKAEYMRMHIGEEYEGVISGVTKWGIYVELPNTVEGLVHVVDLRDDHYNFIEQTYEMVGEHTGKTYKLGEKVRVRVSDADKLLRTINFELA